MGTVQPNGCCVCEDEVPVNRNAPDQRSLDQPTLVEEIFAKPESDLLCQTPVFDVQCDDDSISLVGCGSKATYDDSVGAEIVTAGNVCIEIIESGVDRDMVRGSVKSSASTTFAPRETNHVTQCLQRARNRARMRQICWRLPLVLSGSVIGCVGAVVDFTIESSAYEVQGTLAMCIECVGAHLALLGLLPTDNRAVPVVAAFVVCPTELLCLTALSRDSWNYLEMLQARRCSALDKNVPCWVVMGNFVGAVIPFSISIVIFARLLIALIRRAPPGIQFSLIWSLFGWTTFVLGIANVICAILSLAVSRFDLVWSQGLRGCAQIFNGLWSVFGTSFRDRVQLWFMSRGEAAFAAAGVAELLGNRSIDDVLVAARTSFSYVPADRVLLQDMRDNHPNPDLAALTVKGSLGSVDAFVSHSWHDGPDAKWALLQEYRERFKETHGGREPNLWIDKYCINQNQIDESLACLPVYLFGCKTLLILCGKTYLQRLWCLIELVVFMEMGGDYSKLDVRMLEDFSEELDTSTSKASLAPRAESTGVIARLPSPPRISSRSLSGFRSPASVKSIGHKTTDEKTLLQIIKNFDPRRADCFNDYDRERLHSVIQATGYDQITHLVLEVFLGALNVTCDASTIGQDRGL